ncbi:tRNA (guanosine(46)-N7)-methyltransferase TrmB [Bifidobacterium sp. SMA15]|uniref:tRNA (guanine-N(7)-)-methyltransferase n=2 Tax=Bifidobacterium platyrrhinorum TaxID=2661628 RepID=A0A6L9SWC1_9BIFI|nr:tRNA (guanosine(46)-N7)-methyltransferase TrmB [Bifidobacterium platyrrhinorum]
MTNDPAANGDATDTTANPAPGTATTHGHPLHRVLSFVRRSGRLDARLQRAWDNYADGYLLDVNDGEGSLDVRPGFSLDARYVRETWGNDNPLIIEIGTGQGENIVAAAAARPDVNFLALEVYDPGVAHTLLLAGKQGLRNIRVAQVNAPELFKACADGMAAEVWTFFPDPWPKKKHHKRRIVQPALAGEVRRVLADGGVWRIATDIEDYALHVHEVMDGLDGWRNDGGATVSLPTGHVGKGNADLAADMPHADFTESGRFDGRVLTNFEKKGLAAGRVIHDFTYRKA